MTDDWERGRIQLIGDTAHAMLPNAGQGAAQAFEDAYILARWIAATPGDLTTAAGENFRRIRMPRVHAVQHGSSAIVRAKQTLRCRKCAEYGTRQSRRGRRDGVADGATMPVQRINNDYDGPGWIDRLRSLVRLRG